MDGIAEQLKLTEGVKCAIFMYETDPGTYKVSLRSDGSVNVAKVAALFGGGGHERAAGCTVSAPYHDIINNISSAILSEQGAKDEG
jgi:phosphoesterase RecJ-like protein